MKYSVLVQFVALLFMAGCAKDSVSNDDAAKNQSVETREQHLVTICHQTGNGEFQALCVHENAVTAHLAHGDYLPDADNDGYTAEGACTGSMDDCDDANSAIHPGAAEVCDNGLDDDCDGLTDCDDPDCAGGCTSCPCFDMEFLNTQLPFTQYFDSDVNDCSYYKGVAIFYDPTKVAGAFYTQDGPKFVSLFNGSRFTCEAIVGIDITEAQWESCRDLLREAIAANPGLPNFCNPLLPGGGSASLTRQEDYFKKMTQALQMKLQVRKGE